MSRKKRADLTASLGPSKSEVIIFVDLRIFKTFCNLRFRSAVSLSFADGMKMRNVKNVPEVFINGESKRKNKPVS